MRTKRVAGMFLLIAVLLASLTGCGSEDSETSGKEFGDSGLTYEDAMENDTVIRALEAEEISSSVLEGTWESAEYKEGESRFLVTVWAGVIQIYFMHDHTADVYWVGTCPDMIKTKFTSDCMEQYRNQMLFEYDSLEFIYLDDTLFFVYDTEEGEREGVYLYKASDTVLEDVSLKTVSVVQEIPYDDPEISGVSPAVVTDNTQQNETKTETETKQEGTVEQVCVHNYGSGVVTQAPTCTANGIRTYTCSKCGNVKTETVPATGHSYIYTTKTVATCGTNGVQTAVCSYCGDSFETTIPATGNHAWADITETTEVPEKGHYGTEITAVKGYACNQCSYTSESVGDMESHIENAHGGNGGYSDTDITKEEQVYVVDEEAHTEEVVTGRRCSVCGATE